MNSNSLKGSLCAKRGYCFEIDMFNYINDDIKSENIMIPHIISELKNKIERDYYKKISSLMCIKPERGYNNSNPKADIIIKFTFNDGSDELIGFSLKCSSKSSVSVHECNINTMFKALKIHKNHNNKINQIIKLFFKNGNWKTVEEKFSIEEIKSELEKCRDRLLKWAISSGNGGSKSQYLILYNPKIKKFRICKDDDYIKEISQKYGLKRGCPLSWTRPSKKQGYKIQFKMPLNYKEEQIDEVTD